MVTLLRIRLRLSVGAFVYLVWATVVWGGVLFLHSNWTFNVLFGAALTSLLTNELAFLGSWFWRRRKTIGLEEYFTALLLRTAVPVIAALFVLNMCLDSERRVCAVSLLVAYVLTAPLHVWLLLPDVDENVNGGKAETS